MCQFRYRLLVALAALPLCLGCGASDTPRAGRATDDGLVQEPKPEIAQEPITDNSTTQDDDPQGTEEEPDVQIADADTETSPPVLEDSASDDPISDDADATIVREEGASPEEHDEGIVKRVLLFTKGGPLVVDIGLTIDGQGSERDMGELIDELLLAADTDGDGEPTWEEAVDSPRLAFDEFAGGNAGDRQERIRSYDRDGDNVVDRSEAWNLISHGDAAGIAFRLNRTDTMGNGATSPGDVQHLIDVDYNGQLTAEEIALAPSRLKQGDIDDDDLLLPRELQPPSMAAQQNNARRDRSRRPMPAVLLDAQTSWGVVFYELNDRYHYGGPFNASNFPVAPELVDTLDRDGDQELDRDEVDGLAEIEPHIFLAVEFGVSEGNNAARLRITRVDPQLRLGDDDIIQNSGSIRMELAGMTLNFSAYDTSGANPYASSARDLLDRLDADKNGYLEPQETADDDAADDFSDWDADGDGRVFLEELTAAFRTREAPLLNRIEANVTESRQSLFTALDVSRDGRLSAREMQQAAERFRQLDQDGDGRLLQHEMPGRLSLVIGRGQGGAPQTAGAMAISDSAQSPSAPQWFIGMDSNGDMDVSRREFLGPATVFAHLDTDGDGLLSAQEAATVEDKDDDRADEEPPSDAGETSDSGAT